MTYRQFPDGNGHTIRLFERDGRFQARNYGVKNWHQVTGISSREDDILICAYPKSGLHWLWEIVTMLKTGSTQLSSDRMEGSGFLMIASQDTLDSLPCPRVLTTHRRFHDLPTDFIQKRRKIVCILREPKDICVSYYHMISSLKVLEYRGTFKGFIPLFLAGYVPMGSLAGWILSFEKGLKEHPELSVHVVHYEQLKANPVAEIKRLAQYLGCSEAHVEDVARLTNFSTMKSFKAAVHNPYDKYYKNNKEAIFREGWAEQWRDHFTPEQAEQFDAKLQHLLDGTSRKARL